MENKIFPEDEQLLNYLDGTLDEAGLKEIEKQIRNSSDLQTRLEELRMMHTSLRANALLETPTNNFTQRVMHRLDSFPVNSFSAKNGILLLIGILTAIGVTLLLLQSGVFDSSIGAISLNSLPIRKEWFKSPLPSIPYHGKTIVNIIIMIATGLSFVLLDRTILRPWFEQRRING